MTIRVQTDDFDAGQEIRQLQSSRTDIGAIVSFIGLVRDMNQDESIHQLTLEHYPGMTEKALENIIEQAKQRWCIQEALIIHRVGTMNPGDQIVLVVACGAHRGDTFAACEFMMDYLKTEAPFWKKESTPNGARWVEARESDETARQRWAE